MGFDYLLISTERSSLKIPLSAKCCCCRLLLEEGVKLTNCHHNACYKCLVKRSKICLCPIDNEPFTLDNCNKLSTYIENWLNEVKVKCRWYDGFDCQATWISLKNVRRHEEICANNPKNYSRANHQLTIMNGHKMSKFKFEGKIAQPIRSNQTLLSKNKSFAKTTSERMNDWLNEQMNLRSMAAAKPVLHFPTVKPLRARSIVPARRKRLNKYSNKLAKASGKVTSGTMKRNQTINVKPEAKLRQIVRSVGDEWLYG